MPSADQHRRKAESNRAFLATISRADFPEWVATVAFYTAVHLVERLRAAAGHGDSTGHDDRTNYVLIEHPSIHTAYHALQATSMLARYQARADFFAQFQPEAVEEVLLNRYLAAVSEYVTARLDS
jgi:hypothetical protein